MLVCCLKLFLTYFVRKTFSSRELIKLVCVSNNLDTQLIKAISLYFWTSRLWALC